MIDSLGWKSAQELPRILLDVDVLVNPSLRAWSETFCISNIEAMAMAIPLVTFAVGGTPVSHRCFLTLLRDRRVYSAPRFHLFRDIVYNRTERRDPQPSQS